VLGEEKSNSEKLTDLLATADDLQNRLQIRLHLVKAHSMLNQRIKNYAFLFTRFDDLGIKSDLRGVPYKIGAKGLCRVIDGNG